MFRHVLRTAMLTRFALSLFSKSPPWLRHRNSSSCFSRVLEVELWKYLSEVQDELTSDKQDAIWRTAKFKFDSAETESRASARTRSAYAQGHGGQGPKRYSAEALIAIFGRESCREARRGVVSRGPIDRTLHRSPGCQSLGKR